MRKNPIPSSEPDHPLLLACAPLACVPLIFLSLTPTICAMLYLVGLLLWLTSIAIYRRYVSALSDIPGPFWASFSRLWHLCITIQGNQSERLTEAHEEYGYFVRLANNEVSVSHPDAVKQVLSSPLEKVSNQSTAPNADELHTHSLYQRVLCIK